MWSDEEICRILEIFPEALDSDVLIPRPPEQPLVVARRKNVSSSKSDSKESKSSQPVQRATTSLIDPIWENLDPTPDVRSLFMQFDEEYFSGKLKAVEVRWSPRMTLCAGLCCYEGRGGLCSIRLSEPLLKLRPRSDLVETLLHEMIHAFLFVTQKDRDRESHGPNFCSHMNRINALAGTKITVFHTFHREVENYQKHWWRCSGACRNRPPFYGYVKRAMNRAPGPNDTWWNQHQATCHGTFIKIKEPEKSSKSNQSSRSKSVPTPSSSTKSFDSSRKKRTPESADAAKPGTDIRSYFHDPLAPKSTASSASEQRESASSAGSQSNYAWPESGRVLGGHCEPKQSRLLDLQPISTMRRATTETNFHDSTGPCSSDFSIPIVTSVLDSDVVECPVCTVQIPLSRINEHLDTCIT